MFMLILIALAIAFVDMAAQWRVYQKMGYQGWKSLIPVYSTYVEFGFTWSKLQGILMLAATVLFVISRIFCPRKVKNI